jgi:hypothetical protein
LGSPENLAKYQPAPERASTSAGRATNMTSQLCWSALCCWIRQLSERDIGIVWGFSWRWSCNHERIGDSCCNIVHFASLRPYSKISTPPNNSSYIVSSLHQIHLPLHFQHQTQSRIKQINFLLITIAVVVCFWHFPPPQYTA